jgi:SPP1 gp7 family putative phage head morphogenesis protein
MSELYKAEILTLAQEIYKRKNGLNYSPELLKTTAEKIMQAVKSGYGNIDVEWNAPDHNMIANLTQNVYSFSAAKNYQELRDITNAMVGEEGKLVEWGDFRAKVQEINGKYNRDWLETEYDSAVGSAQSAARWTEFESNKDIMPMLKYQTIGDDKVRKEHKLLDGAVKPINSDFWKTYYPPNGWRCRCEAIQLPYSNVKEAEPQGYPPVPAMFKTNLAKTGLIFPKGHPYFDGVPKSVLRQSMKYLPADAAFEQLQYGNHYVNRSLLQQGDDMARNNELAEFLAKKQECDVWLLPEFDETQPELRKRLVKDFIKSFDIELPEKVANSGMSPDTIIKYKGEFLLFDNKDTSGSELSIIKHLHKANKQAWNVFFTLKDTANVENVLNLIKNNINDVPNLKRFWLKKGSEFKMYSREEL